MVPKVIHQIIGHKPSKLVEICLDSWQELKLFNFKIEIWNDDKIIAFFNKYYPEFLAIISNARNYAEIADIARYLIIYHYGGIYIDWDISLNDPKAFIKMINDCKHGFLIIDPDNGSIASEFFAAKRNEPYLLSLLYDINSTYNNGEQELMNTPQYSGPFRMKVSLKKTGTGQKLVPVKEVFEYDYREIRQADVFRASGIITHFWEHGWIQG